MCVKFKRFNMTLDIKSISTAEQEVGDSIPWWDTVLFGLFPVGISQ